MKAAPYYRKRADAVRAEAARATFPDLREQLLDIAKQYEGIAIQAEDLVAERRRKSNLGHNRVFDPLEK
jgi:hypothetical protein